MRSNVSRLAIAAASLILVLVGGATLQAAPTVAAGDEPGEYRLYVPLVVWSMGGWRSAEPDASWYLNAEGADLAGALAGGADAIWRYDLAASVWNLPPGPGRPAYHVNRSLLAFDLTQLPAGVIRSAGLELCIWEESVRGDLTVTFYRGSWSEPPSSSDWDSFGPELGALSSSAIRTGRDHTWVSLPGLAGERVPQRLELVLRGDESSQLAWGDELSVRITLREGEVVSRLWLDIEVDQP